MNERTSHSSFISCHSPYTARAALFLENSAVSTTGSGSDAEFSVTRDVGAVASVTTIS